MHFFSSHTCAAPNIMLQSKNKELTEEVICWWVLAVDGDLKGEVVDDMYVDVLRVESGSDRSVGELR